MINTYQELKFALEQNLIKQKALQDEEQQFYKLREEKFKDEFYFEINQSCENQPKFPFN